MPLKELHLNLLKNGTVACFDFDAETSDRENVDEDEHFHLRSYMMRVKPNAHSRCCGQLQMLRKFLTP